MAEAQDRISTISLRAMHGVDAVRPRGWHNVRTIMKQFMGVLLVPGLALLAQVVSPTGRASARAPESLGRQAKAILQTHCADCHGGGKGAKGGLRLAPGP